MFGLFAEKFTKFSCYDMVLPTNPGAEAVDTGIKLMGI
jgi:acetylornithine/succinyldiaminopimelate/putrescine aminotransferase